MFRSVTSLNTRWNAFVTQAKIRPGGSCEKGEEAQGDWGDQVIFGSSGGPGTLACTVEVGGDARVDWTTNDVPIWATLWRDDEDIAAAYATWSEARLNPLREPALTIAAPR